MERSESAAIVRGQRESRKTRRDLRRRRNRNDGDGCHNILQENAHAVVRGGRKIAQVGEAAEAELSGPAESALACNQCARI